jgi:hypothetical protein
VNRTYDFYEYPGVIIPGAILTLSEKFTADGWRAVLATPLPLARASRMLVPKLWRK